MATAVSNNPVVTESPGRHVLYQQFVTPHEQIGETIKRSFGALYGRIAEAGVVPAGAPFIIYKSPQPPWEMEVCAPVATEVTPTPDILYREMPASRVVALMRVGPYEQLGEAYDEVQAYIREHNLVIAGPPREFYLSPPETPAERIQTLVEWPIE
jgi:effector-binding domain-containing protein